MERLYAPFALLTTYTILLFFFLYATIDQTPCASRFYRFRRFFPSTPHVLLDIFLLARIVFFALTLHIALNEDVIVEVSSSMNTQIMWIIGSGAVFLATAEALRRSWYKASRLADVWGVAVKTFFVVLGSAVVLAYAAETTSAVLPYTIGFPAPPYVYLLIVMLYVLSFLTYGAITVLVCIAAILVNSTSIYWLSVATVLPRLHECFIYLELYEPESPLPFFILRVGGEVVGILGVSAWSREFGMLCSKLRAVEDSPQEDERSPLLEGAHS